MKQKHTPKPKPSPESHHEMDPTDGGAATLNPSEDITTQLTHRYAASSAAQHRHLIAAATAVKSLITDDNLPLSPLSYFAATISALSRHRGAADSSAALATLLSIALPMVPEGSIRAEKADEAVRVLVRVLEDERSGTACVRCVVKCLGVLIGFCDVEVWNSVQVPFDTLLKCSIDKRPKVRKCALVYLENALKSFQSGSVKKKASKSILALLESHMSAAIKLVTLRNVDVTESKKLSQPEHSDIAHVLTVVRVALPYLSEKITTEVVSKLIELLGSRFSALTLVILSALEAFLEKVEAEVVAQVAENIINTLSSYASSKDNRKDSVFYAANLLKSTLDKMPAGDVKWNKSLLQVVNSIAGLLTCEGDSASQASNILKNLIDHHLSSIEIQPISDVNSIDPDSDPIASMCLVFTNLLDACAGIPNEHILAVLSVMFLKLGRNAYFYMRKIFMKLGEIFTRADGSDTCHLQKCLGCAVVAMGAENVLSLVPMSFNVENSTCSNTWLLPILNKYIFGASLGYFMEHVVPIAKSLRKASHKVKKSVTGQDLQANARGMWGLLPAFCRYPTDICQSFGSFAKLLLVRLEKNTSMRDDIAVALQELVIQNKCLRTSDDTSMEPAKHSADVLEDYLSEKKRLHRNSKKAVSKNLKALSSYSPELLQALMNLFLASPPKKRTNLKKTIRCLASISDSSITKKIFVSFLGRFPAVKALSESGECDLSNASVNNASCDAITTTDDSQWCLMLNLASSVVEGADEDLVGLIFRLTKHALQAVGGVAVAEAYSTLGCILEGHSWFCSSKMDELVDLLIGLKSHEEAVSLSNRLNCLHILLVHSLKNDSDPENGKSFLILNEIIVTLKDSKEEARKTAYDVILRIGSSLGGSSASNPDGPYHRLISMILGYLSGPSPHITSAAVSALSVLVFKEPVLCLAVPDVVPSVTSLLQTKAVEVIKAVLGFIKVFVSCLQAQDLQNFVSVIVDGVMPWSSVSRHHFRSKVTVILEIMIRKCGFPAVNSTTPERYHSFVKKVSLDRHGKTTSKDADSADTEPQQSDASLNGQKKRTRNERQNEDSGSKFLKNKRRKPNQDSHYSGKASNGGVGLDKKMNHFKHKKPGMGDSPGKPKTMKRGRFGQVSGSDRNGRDSGKHRKRDGPKNSWKKR